MDYHAFLYFSITILSLVKFSCCVGLLNSPFTVDQACDVKKRLKNGCFTEKGYKRSRLDCCSSCGRDISCIGALMDISSRMCYHETPCSYVSECPSADLNFEYMYFIKLTTRKSITVTDTVQPPTNEVSTLQSTDLPNTTQLPLTAEPEDHPLDTTETTSVSGTQTMSTNQTLMVPTTTAPQSTNNSNKSSSFCQNMGVAISGTGKCNCSKSGGWVGKRCERYPSNCSELKDYGYPTGSYTVKVNIYQNDSQVITHCEIGNSNHVNIGILKSTGSYDNNHSWNDYVSGFYHSDDDYWLGLANILAYNAQGNTNFGIYLNFSSSLINGFIERIYTNFHLRGSSERFAFSVDSQTSYKKNITTADGVSSADIGLSDLLQPLQGIGFSTYDKDHDEEENFNCASTASAGWWFGQCQDDFFANPLGWSYTFNGGDETPTHVRIPGLNMSDAVKNSLSYVYMYLEEPE